MDFDKYGVTDSVNIFIGMQDYPNASQSFSEALKFDPANKEIQKAHR